MSTLKLDRQRIRWGCRRGMLELDMLLLSFFDNCFDGLTFEQQQQFVDLLTYPDQQLFVWLMGRETPENASIQSIIQRIRDHQQTHPQS